MSTSKRVSFGENGSMVETLIIDNSSTMPAEEKHFYQENILRENLNINTKLKEDMESHENPFVAGGELDHKADYIIRHSKISRTEIRIADPDSPQPEDEIQMETMEKVQAAPVSGAPGNPRENGKVEDPLKPQDVEVDVGKANASQPETQEAEQVKGKDKKPKCKCCVIQ